MEHVAVIGLGYVGLPVALAFARAFPTIGFDIDGTRIAELRTGTDRTGEASPAALAASTLTVTDDVADLRGNTLFIVTVPTPVDAHRRPDLSALRAASATVGSALQAGGVVVYESTVYPGVTEDVCGPILASVSGLRQGVDFKLGYSPERINPGDAVHRFEKITKVVAGEDAGSLERIAAAYGAILEADVFRAASIKVAEAAKVIENTQRDLNIALMNELAVIFDRLDISTRDVLAAAGTKWNFLPFTPGLVGGHCIGVDPYYLTAKAESVGYHPDVILAGRRINDGMGRYVAQRVVKALNRRGRAASDCTVGVLGLTFKENVPDTRNSKVPDIVAELRDYGTEVRVHDPFASPAYAAAHWAIELQSLEALDDLDALVLAVAHRPYLQVPAADLFRRIRGDGVFFDVKSVVDRGAVPARLAYQSL